MNNALKILSVALAFSLGLGVSFVASATNAPLKCKIQAYDGHYLTAVGGGGRTSEAIHTNATVARSWEYFFLVDVGDGSSRYGIQTINGNFLTAVGGGGRIVDVIHSDATRMGNWEKFTFDSLGFGWYTIRAATLNYVTAVNSGGLAIADALHTDAVRASTWEKFKVTCNPY